MAIISVLISAVFAGSMIGIAGTTSLSAGNTYIGSLLFCVGLYTICAFGLRLYTGRVGYVIDDHSKENLIHLLLTWIGNFIGAALTGYVVSLAKPDLKALCENIANNRLAQNFSVTIAMAFFCGMLMYIAVHTYKITSGKVLGMLLCVPAFIISGFEHSVADMYYFACAGAFAKSILHILLVSVGNALGAIAVAYAMRFKK